MAGGALYVLWTYYMLFCRLCLGSSYLCSCCNHGSEDAKKVSRLAKKIILAAEKGFQRGDYSDWKELETMGVKREELLKPLPLAKLRMKPGPALQTFVFFILDMITDTIAWTKFLSAGHYAFAGMLATITWWSTLMQFRRGLWAGMVQAFSQVLRGGVQTEQFIELYDSEKGLETLFSMCVQVYALNYAGLTDWFGVVNNNLSIVLSMYGLASYLVDNVDLAHHDEADSEDDEGSAARVSARTLGLAASGRTE